MVAGLGKFNTLAASSPIEIGLICISLGNAKFIAPRTGIASKSNKEPAPCSPALVTIPPALGTPLRTSAPPCIACEYTDSLGLTETSGVVTVAPASSFFAS